MRTENSMYKVGTYRSIISKTANKTVYKLQLSRLQNGPVPCDEYRMTSGVLSTELQPVSVQEGCVYITLKYT